MSQKPCLPVPQRQRKRRIENDNNLNEDDQLSFQNIESMDAMEYMSLVVQQAESMPDVFVSSSTNDIKKNNNSNNTNGGEKLQQQQKQESKQTNKENRNHMDVAGASSSLASLTHLLSDHTLILPPPSTRHIPATTKSWVDTTMCNFSKLRDYIDYCKRNGVGGKLSKTRLTNLPKLKDRSGWHIFCLGYNEATGNINNYFDTGSDDDNEDEEDIIDNDKEKENNNEIEDSENNNNNDSDDGGHEPTVKLLLQMDQVMIRRIIQHLCYYIDDGWIPYTKRCTAWLYALLASLEKPIHRDDAHTLYSLLKILTQLRHDYKFINNDNNNNNTEEGECKCSEDNENLKRLNLLIVIIGIYFEQGNGYDGVMSVPNI